MSRFVYVALLCALAFAATAQSTAQDPAAAASATGPDARAERDRLPSDRNCLRQTGSRITAAANRRADAGGQSDDKGRRRCAPVAGRSYDRDDLERTGQTNIANALRMLDPAMN